MSYSLIILFSRGNSLRVYQAVNSNFSDIRFQDPVDEIQRLSEALGESCNPDLIKAIADSTSFENLKADKQPIANKKNKMFADGTYAIYRKGKSFFRVVP